MHLKLDGHALVAGLAPLRSVRKPSLATIKACPQELGKLADISCGAMRVSVPIFDRRSWSDTVEFDGAILKSLASLSTDDLFMDVCRVEYVAGRIVFAENISVAARILDREQSASDQQNCDCNDWAHA